jgi:hypothetical protein
MPIKKPDDFDNEIDIDERRPKPYRYIKDNEDIKEETINFHEDQSFTVMDNNKKSNIKLNYDNPTILSNNKNIGKVEDIIKKHEEIKKFKDFY